MAIKITAFMTVFKNRKTDEEKNEMIKKHLKNEYVPYEKKADIAKAIINNTYWKKEIDEDIQHLHIDSIACYMLKCMAIVDLYTDIERQKGDGKMLEDFNTLNSYGVLDLIVQNMDQRELKEFNMILQMTQDDVIANEFENHAFISQQVERFGKLISTALAPVLSQIDLEQVKEVINQLK
jgi:hypothetical protein